MNVKRGLRVVRSAKQNCAVDTGRLRASITIRDSENVIAAPPDLVESSDFIEPPSVKWSVRVGTNVFYGVFVEYGTVNQPAQPYLRPALDLHYKLR